MTKATSPSRPESFESLLAGSAQPINKTETWFILAVMYKGEPPPFRRGRPKNIWVALLINVDPDLHCTGQQSATLSRYLDLGRHKSRDEAWDYAEDLLATRH